MNPQLSRGFIHHTQRNFGLVDDDRAHDLIAALAAVGMGPL